MTSYLNGFWLFDHVTDGLIVLGQIDQVWWWRRWCHSLMFDKQRMKMKLKLVGFFLSCFLWIIHGMLAPPGELHELLHCELRLWFSNRDSGPTRDLGTTSACWTEINKRFFKRGRLHDQQHTDYSRGRPSAAAGEDRVWPERDNTVLRFTSSISLKRFSVLHLVQTETLTETFPLAPSSDQLLNMSST